MPYAADRLVAEELGHQLRRTLYLASRATDKRVATAASASYIFLQRAAAASLAADCRAKVRQGCACEHRLPPTTCRA